MVLMLIYGYYKMVSMVRQYRSAILHESIEVNCRRCRQSQESIEHIMNGCSTLASSDYLQRHNNVAKIVHQELALRSKLVEEKNPFYRYQPAAVLLSSDYKLYWDRFITMNHTILANRPDIVWIDKRNNSGYLIDIVVPLMNNLNWTFAEKIGKYVELAQEIKQREALKTVRVVPVIISSAGIVAKTVVDEIKSIKCEYLLHELSKAVILSMCRILQKFLQLPWTQQIVIVLVTERK